MRVAIDISHLNHEKLSGVGVYTLEMMKALGTFKDLELTPVFRPTRWKSRRFFKRHVGPSQPWIAGGFGLKSDILHGPDFRVSRARRARRVVSIMDLAFLTEGMTSPEFARKKKRDLDELLDEQTPDELIAISEATKRELLAYRPQLEGRVHVTLLGGDHFNELSSPADPERLQGLGSYFLFVGNLEARKNILGILAAFEIFARNSPSENLILIGKPGYDSERILAAVAASPFRSRIHVLGYCSLADLQAYYRRAIALVYPSWIEGFGIPVVEAMHLGCPVITSSTTSTAEIIGETNWGLDPADTAGIARAMAEAAALNADPTRREAWTAKGKTQAQAFTWRRCAEQTVAAYRLALK